MDNAGKLIKEIAKAIPYLIFVYPFKWVWKKLSSTGKSGG